MQTAESIVGSYMLTQHDLMCSYLLSIVLTTVYAKICNSDYIMSRKFMIICGFSNWDKSILQGDPSGSSKPIVDIDLKVAF